MSILEEIIQLADNITRRLEKAAEDEKKFCHDMQLQLERYSWETFRLANGLRQLGEFYGEG
jgi:hypothetical protein